MKGMMGASAGPTLRPPALVPVETMAQVRRGVRGRSARVSQDLRALEEVLDDEGDFENV